MRTVAAPVEIVQAESCGIQTCHSSWFRLLAQLSHIKTALLIPGSSAHCRGWESLGSSGLSLLEAEGVDGLSQAPEVRRPSHSGLV